MHITPLATLIASVFYQGEYLSIISDRLTRGADDRIYHQSYTFIDSPFADAQTTFAPNAPPHFEFHIHALAVRDLKGVTSVGAMVEFSGPVAESRARLIDVAEGKKGFILTPDFQAEMSGYIKRMVEP